MAETSGPERLSPLELQVLLWDDFGWSGDIGALAVLTTDVGDGVAG